MRNAPRVTLNALADYLTATAGRRRGIVAEQRRPKTFRVAYYAEAETAISAALAGGLDQTALDRGIERVHALPASKEWEIARRQTELDAIEACRAFLREGGAATLPPFSGAPQRARQLMINGVSVSVRPDLLVQPAAGPVTGALKLYFSKSAALTDERARYAGAVLHFYVEQILRPSQQADYRQCFVLDVFARALYAAPRTYRRRRQDIEAACAEIAAIWQGA
jgi:hypothetical protein